MKVYLDNSATTAVDKEVLDAMLPYYSNIYGNPSSLHAFGREALKAVDESRQKIASILGAKPAEIYFTSGGTESDNWAIKGAVGASKSKTKHIITSAIEHPAVLETCEAMQKEGAEVTYIKVNSDGLVNPDDVSAAIKDNTAIISIMAANNEIGAVQPITAIGAIAKEEGILFHTDAVQAADSQILDVNKQNIDLLSLSAHKFHGPKGIGLLFMRSGVRIDKLVNGGHQERRQRAGTTATPLIVGMAKALEISARDREANNKRIAELRDYLIGRAINEIPYCYLNGGMQHRLPNNANLSFGFIEGESVLMSLDLKGIAVSSGSACSSGSLEASHVLLALGIKEELAHSSIRFSLGRETTKEEIEYTINTLKEIVDRLRGMSPLFNIEKGTGSYV